MKRISFGILSLFLFSIFIPKVHAASVTHTWPGTGTNGDNTLDVDDQGGSFDNGGNDNTYSFGTDTVDHVSTLTLILFDGLAVDDGDDIDDDSSDDDATGEDFSGGSGLTILEPPSILTPPITEIAALSDNPLTPFSFQGGQTGLDVRQLSYVQSGRNFAIFEYIVTNNTGSIAPVKIGLAGDFDVDESSGSDNNVKDLSVPVVLEFDSTANGTTSQFYAAGLALVGGTLDNYRLGSCCDVTFESTISTGTGSSILDAQRLAYFNNRPNEECDDGNNSNGDGCSANCQTETGAEVCGNGTVEAGEGCDDSNTNNGDGCDDTCRSETCGDGALDADEECDDGGTVDGDGCSAFCTAEFNDAGHFCGDDAINNGGTGDQFVEADSDVEVTISADLGDLADGQSAVAAFCIVGGISSVDGPSAGADAVAAAQECKTLYQTQIAVCGNGVLNAGEQCDDGNTADDDGCASNCSLPGCGNGVLEAGEECDDGNTADDDGCSAQCDIEIGAAVCGNGILEAGEECDDGNNDDNDLCSNACTDNTGFQLGGSGCSLTAVSTSAGFASFGWTALALAGFALRRRAR